MNENLTKSELIELVAKDSELTIKNTRIMMDSLIRQIRNSLAEKKTIKLAGLGTFTTVQHKSKKGINPQTGQEITIPAKIKPKFIPGKNLADIVNNYQPNSEKRKLQRRNFVIDMEVFDLKTEDQDNDSPHLLGDLADITAEGIMVVSDTPLKENYLYDLKVILPEKFTSVNEITFKAKSIQCSKTKHEHIFTTGFRIKEIDQVNLEKIRRFIEEFAV